MRIGFIGLGIMGSRMAVNLQKAGYELVVHNRTKAKADELVANGATWAATPADVGQAVDILFTMLSAPDAVSESALGENGFLRQLKAGVLWIDCSTVNPSFSKQMAAKAVEQQVKFLDAPVAGTKQPAESGELLFLVGGDKADVETGRPYFDAMGRGVVHLGDHGMGASMKMVVNLMLAQGMAAFAEAMSLGEALGLPRALLLDAVPGSAVAAPFLSGKISKIGQDEFGPDFPLQWMHKDLQMVATTAYEQGVSLPLGNAAKEVYAMARQQGLGELDFSVIYRFFKNDDAG
jgi:3-hydroxyisobutyrate dehydrogenase/glyoxylate/succinic semialdehyde reductase